MIISASRRTDLPAAHVPWMLNRFREGFALVRNPMNPRQVQRISLRREDVDGIVFWTKNPLPMLDHLRAWDGYAYYFQYTLTAYGRDVEANLPPHTARVDAFKRLSDALGPHRVLWRYDPILISPDYPASWHEDAFGRLAEALKGRTERVTISFVDTYARNRKRLETLQTRAVQMEEMRTLAATVARIARQNGMQPVACCEPLDMTDCGVGPSSCVDAGLLGRIGGVPLKTMRDLNQRDHCGCAPSVDIGTYNTCPNGCVYCYANYSPALLRTNLAQCDPASPLLCGTLNEDDVVKERKMPSLREEQLRMDL